MTTLPGQAVALYERILEAVPGGVVHVAYDGSLLLANQPAQDFLGLRLDTCGQRYVADFAGETFRDDGSICPVEDYPVSRCLATNEAQAPRVIGVRQPAGEVRWAVFTALPFDPGDGAPPGAVVSFVDITQRKLAEEQVRVLQAELAQRERLATVGTLAAAVAHEVNNPLAFIFLAIEGISDQLDGGDVDRDRLREDLADVLQGATRVRNIVRDLMTFSKIRDRTEERSDVNEAIETAVRMAAPEIRYRAEVALELQQTRKLAAAAGRLSQVVLNLVLNAGRSFAEPSSPTARIEVTSREVDGTVTIDVNDNGPGVDPAVVDRIFDPFFTTRDDGTGLGLSISRSLVEEMGGTLELVYDGRLTGACFRVRIPCEQRHSPHERDSANPATSQRRSILLVDDEDAIRRLGRAVLTPAHRVVVASSVTTAVEALQSDEFDLVVCDTMLLDGSGIDVFHWVREHRPALVGRFLFMTGGAFTRPVEQFFAANDVPVLHKPFGRAQLVHSIEALLSAL